MAWPDGGVRKASFALELPSSQTSLTRFASRGVAGIGLASGTRGAGNPSS